MLLSEGVHKHGNLVIAHATRSKAFTVAWKGKVDIVTCLPIGAPLDEAAAMMKDDGRVSVPTLIIEKAILNAKNFSSLKYAPAKVSAAQLHRASVPILTGTDANQTPMAPVKHRESLHE